MAALRFRLAHPTMREQIDAVIERLIDLLTTPE
jgi:hypothetical protein